MTYTVRTPFLFWFGAVTLAATLAAVVAALWEGAWIAVLFLGTMFGGAGAALFFMSATLSGDAEGLTVARIGGKKAIRWADVERVAAGGGNLVLYKKGGGRVTAPSFEFWRGREKSDLVLLLSAKLKEHAIAFSGASLRAMVHFGDR